MSEWALVQIWLFLIAATLLGFLLSGCKSTQYVEVPVIKTDTLRQTRTVRDSIYLHDSVVVRMAGDTVCIEKWHTRWRDRLRIDTVYHASHDTIAKPYPVEVIKKVERELTAWQRFQLRFAKVMMLVLVAICAYWVWKIKHRVL